MRLRLLLILLASLLLDTLITAQTSSGWIPSSPVSTAINPAPAPAPVAAPTTPDAAPVTTSGTGDADEMTSSDFEIDGTPYAKVLYLEGNVWIRPPGDATFHQLEQDEPIANQSVIYTGFNGTLDFATGPGMAVRMVPKTALVVNTLPAPASASPTAPPISQVDLRKGTIFSALGQENGAPVDYSVQTPSGVAGARGTMFATSVVQGTTQVSMLHGTVNFETPDHQTSQITAGQSQQITGGAGGRYQLSGQRPLAPANSEAFFNHAGGLLEHASGYGVVRRGLGADVANEMQRHGYRLPAGTMERFQNVGKTHYQNKPMFNRAKTPQARSTTHHTTTGSRGTAYHPSNQTNKPLRHNQTEDEERRARDKDLGK